MIDRPADSHGKGAATWWRSRTMLGALCGAGAALGWHSGLLAALHGIRFGLPPADISLHRYAWLGPLRMFFVFRHGFAAPGGIAWRKGLGLTAFAGPRLALF